MTTAYNTSASIATGIALSLMASFSFAEEYNLQSAFPKGLPVITETAEYFTDRLGLVTDGEIDFTYLGAGEMSPPLEILSDVGAGKIDAGWTSPAYDSGNAPAAALFGSIPFGPDTSTYFHWIHGGGGLKIMREVYEPFNVVPMPCSMIMAEAGGWFMKDIDSKEDFKDLRFRIGELGGKVLAKLGAVSPMLPVGEIASAFEKGDLDGTELGYPMVDKLMGFEKIAKKYYFPGWHQPSGIIALYVNKDLWDGWSKAQRVAVDMACKDASQYAVSFAAAKQLTVLTEFREAGVEVKRFPDTVLSALRDASEEVLEEEAENDAAFLKALTSFTTFFDEYDGYRTISALPSK